MPARTPRVFIVRHGETEWSLNGRHTGITELPLTANGEKRIRATGRALVGNDRLIVESRLAHIYVSPRKRARRTLELLGLSSSLPWHENPDPQSARAEARVEVTEAVREWDYGEYEGKTSAQIRQEREEKGEGEWDIWRDGCPGGESPRQITERLDRLIDRIRRDHHAPAMDEVVTDAAPPAADVLIVAHGHILRALAARWVARSVAENPNLVLEAGGVGTLSYEHHSLEEPAIWLGASFVTDVVVEELERKHAPT